MTCIYDASAVTNLNFNSFITTDGSDIYGALDSDDPNNVSKFVVNTNTESDIATGFTGQKRMPVWWNGKLYISQINASGGNFIHEVKEWDGVSWTTVYTLTQTIELSQWGLFTDAEASGLYIVASRNTINPLTVHPTPLEELFLYSTDGTTWNPPTISGRTDATRPLGYSQTNNHGGHRSPRQGSLTSTFTARQVIAGFTAQLQTWTASNGTITFVEAISSGLQVWQDGQFYWRSESGTWKYSSNPNGPWTAPTTNHTWVPSFGLSKSVARSEDVDNIVYYHIFVGPDWGPGVAVFDYGGAVSPIALDYVVRLDDGRNLVATNTATDPREWYRGDCVLDENGEVVIPETDNGKRLWIYKGNGIDWSSRGLKVA